MMFVAVLFAGLLVPEAVAADGAAHWPAVELGKDFRGPGYYLGVMKILCCWIIFLCWVVTTDWLSRDCQQVKLNWLRWNPIAFGTFMGAFVLTWLSPYFWLNLVLLVVAYVAPLTTYTVYRNKRVDDNQRVLTKTHIRWLIASYANKIGIKMEAEAPDVHAKGPPVRVEARGGGDDRENNARLLRARQHPGLRAGRSVLADGLGCRASAIMLDYTQQGVAVRCMVDGVWLQREAIDREEGDPALEALKLLCGLNPQDRQGRQAGTFTAIYKDEKYYGKLSTQGTKTGERAVVQFEESKIKLSTLDELGMRPKMQEQVKELLDRDTGMLLVSAPPASGLRTTMDVLLHQTDRLMREFAAMEAEDKRYEQVENIPVTTFSPGEDPPPTQVFAKLLRTEPNVVVFRDLPDADTASSVCEAARDDILVISTMRAKDSAEAALRVLALGLPGEELAGALKGVLCQRLIRKLCDECKEAYMPPPQVLKQLGIPEGRVQAFYRPPQQPEEVCEHCSGIGYHGRTAIYELLLVGQTVRKVLAAKPKLDLLRSAARKDGMRTFQEEGILLVAKGTTSLPELMRVLKQ